MQYVHSRRGLFLTSAHEPISADFEERWPVVLNQLRDFVAHERFETPLDSNGQNAIRSIVSYSSLSSEEVIFELVRLLSTSPAPKWRRQQTQLK
jgi:hypothetical protein